MHELDRSFYPNVTADLMALIRQMVALGMGAHDMALRGCATDGTNLEFHSNRISNQILPKF